MATRTMPQNDVVITDLDSDRLNSICQSPRYRATYGMLLTDLRAEMAGARVVPALGVPREVVTMRSTVRLRDLESGEEETFTLVYPNEADIDNGKLSVLAPLGTALLGAQCGRTISVRAPAGIRRMKVERIVYQPEAAGDTDL